MRKLRERLAPIFILGLVAILAWDHQEEVLASVSYMANLRWEVAIPLLVANVVVMYLFLGQVFKRLLTCWGEPTTLSTPSLARISFEADAFFNRLGVEHGLRYMAKRLKQVATVSRVEFAYVVRYWLTIAGNQLQLLIAIVLLLCTGAGLVSGTGRAMITLATVICAIIIGGLIVTAATVSSNGQICSWLIRRSKLNSRISDLHDEMIARGSAGWPWLLLQGCVFAFLEVTLFWIIAIAMGQGQPDLLINLLLAEAVAAAIGAITPTPAGVGGYELVMIGVLAALGTAIPLAIAVTVVTRVTVLLGTVASGYYMYRRTLKNLNEAKRAAEILDR